MTALRPFSHEQIQLPSGLKLEASLSLPPNTDLSAATKLAVCLHPWSWLGGRMDDPCVILDRRVLHALKGPLSSKGYCILRYNSRGVGLSSGWPSFTGTQEAKDLEELVQWALSQMPSVTSVVAAGYSHGSLVVSLFPLLPESTGIHISHILLSYPLGPRAWLTAFRSGHYTTALNTLIQDPRSNVLVIYGDHDEFTSVESYDAWAESLRRENEGDDRGSLQILRVEGANHFWVAATARDRMLRTIHEWVP